MIDRVVLDRALAKYGATNQMFMAMEEMSELITAISHWFRKRNADEDVAEEIADVLIMMWQMRIMFGEKLVDNFVRTKLQRLQERIENDEASNGD